MKSLFVGNLNFQTSEGELRALFEPFGAVTRVHMAMDRETGRARGFAFIEMPNDEEAAKAIAGLDGTMNGGRQLKVNEARPRGEGGGPPRGGNRGRRLRWRRKPRRWWLRRRQSGRRWWRRKRQRRRARPRSIFERRLQRVGSPAARTALVAAHADAQLEQTQPNAVPWRNKGSSTPTKVLRFTAAENGWLQFP